MSEVVIIAMIVFVVSVAVFVFALAVLGLEIYARHCERKDRP